MQAARAALQRAYDRGDLRAAAAQSDYDREVAELAGRMGGLIGQVEEKRRCRLWDECKSPLTERSADGYCEAHQRNLESWTAKRSPK